MTKPRRGDVVLVLFPSSDLRTAKRRPAFVLQRDELGTGLSQTIVAMISSDPARAGHPSRVGNSDGGGLWSPVNHIAFCSSMRPTAR